MIVLLDTDVLIDVALKREPFSQYSSKILELAEQKVLNAFIAWHSISNFYYIVESKSKNYKTTEFIRELLQFIQLSSTKTKDAIFATTLNVSDFEDAMQIAAANACNAELIITRNVKHYKLSPIKAKSPMDFIKNLIN